MTKPLAAGAVLYGLLVAGPAVGTPPARQTAPAATQPMASRPVGPVTSAARRIASRDLPSVFQAWNPAEGLQEDPRVTMARHDLVFHVPFAFGLRWNHRYEGLATGFTPQSIRAARRLREQLLAINPSMVLLASVQYRDAMPDYLPAEHPWWKRDKDGKRIVGWDEGPAYLLDFAREDYRKQAVLHCRAVMAAGVVDGIMLDWWHEDQDRLVLVREIREAIGPDALILANTNDQTAPLTGQYINGFFMECWRTNTPQDWRRIEETLAWAERNLRRPHINCLETWCHESRQSPQDLAQMRATTTLSLTRCNGYCLFGDPNELPKPDHLHDWYPFWNAPLGRPTEPGWKREDGAWQRAFTHGTAVYNPVGNRDITVRFDEPHTSVATGKSTKTHTLGPLDGDIYLAERKGPATAD